MVGLFSHLGEIRNIEHPRLRFQFFASAIKFNLMPEELPVKKPVLTMRDAVEHLCLLTMKPVIYVANVAENEVADPGSNPHVKEVMKLAAELHSRLVTILAQVESELSELPAEERVELLNSLGVS
ncbi:hypothetical protein Droror1_Dr00023427 [Drosera rotundifolia]